MIIHLLEESAPELTNGSAGCTLPGTILLAQRERDAPGAWSLSLGFPRLLRVTDFPALRLLDGLHRRRLNLGDAYDLEQPFDELLDQRG